MKNSLSCTIAIGAIRRGRDARRRQRAVLDRAGGRRRFRSWVVAQFEALIRSSPLEVSAPGADIGVNGAEGRSQTRKAATGLNCSAFVNCRNIHYPSKSVGL
jgi:hypothetical protein